MTIVDSYLSGPVKNDVDSLTLRYQYMMYDLESELVDHVQQILGNKKTLILFSGSWRFNWNFTYIELKMTQYCKLNFHPSTLFVEPERKKLMHLTLKSINPENIAIIHSDYWTAHLPMNKLLDKIDALLPYVQLGGKVVCTVPLTHLNFNRLTTRYQDLKFPVIKDSMIIVREK